MLRILILLLHILYLKSMTCHSLNNSIIRKLHFLTERGIQIAISYDAC